MAEYAGYILVHRCLLDSSVWNDGEKHNRKSAWIDLLLKVNHADKKKMVDGKEITIQRGQRLTSIAKLAIEWGVTRKTASKWINAWKSAGMVYVDSTTRYTLITILKYSVYQDGKTSKGKGVYSSVPNSVSNSVSDSVAPLYTQTNNEKNVNNEKKVNKKDPTVCPGKGWIWSDEKKRWIAPPRGGGSWQ